MISQRWLTSGNKCLMGVTFCPKEIRAAALILPGYGMHMCDVDYFMSKLARKLYADGVYVLLLDPYGHGDSYGNLQDCTINSLIEDINIGIEHCKRICDKIYCFSRGLIANLLTNTSSDVNVIGLSPICVKNESLSKVGICNEVVEISEYIPGDDYVAYSDFDKDKLCLIEMIGGRIRHIHGQYINPDILQYVIEADHLKVLQQRENAHWIFYNNDGKKQFKICKSHDVEYHEMISYFKQSIYRDALWQHNVIEEITRLVQS